MRMRQKVSISRLPIRLGIFLLLYFVPQSLSAQENNDSTHILRNGASITLDDVLKQANINLFPEKSTTYSLYSPGQLEHPFLHWHSSLNLCRNVRCFLL